MLAGYKLEKIWHPVTRCWHWVLVVAVCVGWGFGNFMSFDTVQWHFYIGYLILGLMAFRFLWGFFGPNPTRFSNMLPTPSALRHYLSHVGKREPSGTAGHNPLGSLSVFALLIAITAQACCGLFIESEEFFEYAPLSGYVTEATINRLIWWHHLIANIIAALVALHVGAVLFYLWWKHENLIKPMITGRKWVKQTPPKSD